ncbi:MAG: Copper binding protein plastocyanin/azurin family [Solirubrobacterales bacterium]|jgi:plastocyanin|nr:Copper binding protein plastocyanin/azurin family [Solirubrobacterales bacterium]
MRRVITIAATLAVVLVVSNPFAAGRAKKVVEVDDDFYNPASLTIKEDTTVDFTWVGEGEHNVFKNSGPGRYFESDNSEETGFVFSHKFKKPGNYTLGCILHEDMDMSLKVKKRR